MSRAAGDGSPCRGRSLAVRFRYLLLASIIFGASLIVLSTNRKNEIVRNRNIIVDDKSSKQTTNSELNYTIKTVGCRIPTMEPFSDDILKFVEYPSQLKPCLNSSYILLDSNKSKIWVVKEKLAMYNVSTEEPSLQCCYQAFDRPARIEDITDVYIDDRVNYEDCKYFKDTISVQNEFVKVECEAKSVTFYKQYFLFAPKKTFIQHDDKVEKSTNESAYNVLILGIDAVSRLNFHRTMPKTLNFLKNRGAVDMMGYNKVGDNTFPNLVPMLIGIKEDELKKVCHPHQKATFDNCPFIWEWFKQAGFYTAIGEDSSSLGTFNYFRTGFANTPADYYIHTYINEVERNIATNKDFNSKLCVQEKYIYKILLDYVEELTTTLNGAKLFGFFWEITMSHDYLNYPMVMDNDYLQFFNKLEAKHYLDDTIVILVSDHGIRWGEIRSTEQGRLEERLPFLFVLTPPSFRENYTKAYDHLKLNSKRLTTPFDLHATLSDLVDLSSITDTQLLARSKTNYSGDRSISLFLPISYNRTCKIANIDDHWCTCREHVALSKSDPKASEAAASLVSFLNKKLANTPQCANLSLSELLDISMLEAGKPMEGEVKKLEVMVVVRTEPGGGVFEATLRKDSDGWSPVGTVSRLNLYGEQSRCVDDYHLKLYCYCQ